MFGELSDDRPSAAAGPPPQRERDPGPPERHHYAELARRLRSVGVVNRELARRLPPDCPPASAGLLTLLRRHGEMRMSRLTELLGIDLSVTSRHVAHAAERGWIERLPDPADGRSRILHLTARGERQLDELSDLATETMREVLADWSTEDVVTLNALLDRLGASFGGCRTRGGHGSASPSPEAPDPPEPPGTPEASRHSRTRQ